MDGRELINSAQPPTAEMNSVQVNGEFKRETETGRICSVLALSLIVCIGGVIGGYSHGFPSPTLLELQKQYENGDRVDAFSSDSFYAGLFGVS